MASAEDEADKNVAMKRKKKSKKHKKALEEEEGPEVEMDEMH